MKKIKKKIQYIWDYYKWIFVVLAGLLCLPFLVCAGYESGREAEELQVVVVDAVSDGSVLIGLYQQRYGQARGIAVDTSFVTNDELGAVTAAAHMGLAALLLSGGVDVLICDEVIYDQFAPQAAFESLAGLMPEGAAGCSLSEGQDAVLINARRLNEKEEILACEEAYLCIAAGAKHRAQAEEFIRLLME